MADFATDAAITEASNQPAVEEHGVGPEGDNKFQKAISAWRSEKFISNTYYSLLTTARD